ncbi:hypothetical protein M9978_22135 [Sphingomonas sp. MG17]|uniref:Uncharacterized protein n=1 Tax=Sphingomonas tagetis TaxID=2949092 RepID=A0A9X2HW56_9SPHN|nr:hypothetical protein [Sphingomonas tagetis]MCP3733110.1 hypothetical protein [Sphingomonas tagetis]
MSKAEGHEIESGKLQSPESSAALAANAFGWFLERPADLPPPPPIADLDWPAERLEIERQMRFPWNGGRHPWLDAAVETPSHIIGIESKRYEPFRDAKKVNLSPAYDRDVWGAYMRPFTAMCDRLRSGELAFTHLEAAQLVKHAFGLVTEGRRVQKAPVLLYLFAEPACRGPRTVSKNALARHREEIARFAAEVDGAEVRFAACSYREWLANWSGEARIHANSLLAHFQP